ncbi:pentatricopeptide repeat-containing protein [Prunus yedoensis var. nudiflora]|uniref:Pentatricopeptide repeat-containing protein n=1 Tax=Prunus yedoensis var. nudiflora TaxID=2094558 RepID=A0A314ZS37_PRUYE|nr:pentatricopeptide repeat-containing protein [Prunus yedoensis var. nudiflora]
MNDCTVVSWTTMISIDKEDAIFLYNEMRLDGVYPNDVTFVGLIHAISIRKLVEEGEMIHGFCIKTGFLSKHDVCNSLITMYAKFESMPDSIKVFEELNCREIISWIALISGLGLETGPIIAAALLDMYAKQGSICESKRVFSETPHKSQFAWTAIISAYAGHGDNDSVIELFKEMEKEGVKPDSVTFLSILAACSRNGMVEMGRHLFHSMVKEYHIEPSPQHYSSMVDMLGRAGKLEKAEELIRENRNIWFHGFIEPLSFSWTKSILRSSSQDSKRILLTGVD